VIKFNDVHLIFLSCFKSVKENLAGAGGRLVALMLAESIKHKFILSD